MAEETDKQKLARYEYVIEAYVAELTKLRDENARLRSAAGAHDVLKSIYLDPDSPQGNRIKAAQAALQHEVPKLMPERAPLELTAEPVRDLGKLHEARLKRQLEGEVVDGSTVTLLPIADGRARNGNGSDDHS